MHIQHDVQTMSTDDTTVYEAVAAVSTQRRAAHVADVVHMTGLPEETVRRSLAFLTENGWLKTRGGIYILGPHDWEVDY